MSLRTLANYYFFNLESERIGLYFSFFLHCFILLLVIGLPNFFGPSQIILPNIIPIEIVNVSDITSISNEVETNKKEISKEVLKNKKFDSSKNQEIKKIDIKTKPETEIKNVKINKIKKEVRIIEKKIKTPLKLKKEEKITKDDQYEALPSIKIKPKIKPKPIEKSLKSVENTDVVTKALPKPKPQPKFSIASMLKDLRNEQSSIVDEKKDKKVDKKNDSLNNKDNKNEISQLSISEIDLFIQQLSSCWNAPAGAVIKRGMVVKIEAKIKQNRRILENSVRIIDTNISQSNPFYGPITESAMRTLMNPLCIPLKLPLEKYELWKKLIITFDHSIMKGY